MCLGELIQAQRCRNNRMSQQYPLAQSVFKIYIFPLFPDNVYLSSGPTVMFRFKSDALGNAPGFSFIISTEGKMVPI